MIVPLHSLPFLYFSSTKASKMETKAENHMTSAAAFVEGGIQESCDDACSICLEEFCDNDPSTTTACRHEFHLQCVLEWYAVVTGANKGIGFEICKQLASIGITVIVTARDECRGLQAFDKLKQELDLAMSHSDNVIFHHLHVADPNSISSLANFIKIHFGKLDILVNNAGLLTENEELTEAILKTNYYGPKGLIKAFFPLLQFSSTPRIVNVSSTVGRLEYFPNGWPKEVLSDAEKLTEEKIDKVVNEFLNDFKEGSLETKGWPLIVSAYSVSKAAISAYTRMFAKKYPSICINAICPGYVKTDINSNTGTLTTYEGAEPIVRLALSPDGSASGLFFSRYEDKPF